jgi:hypothetical protein
MRDGEPCVTDGTFAASGCHGVAVALIYANSPKIATASRATPPTNSAIQVWYRIFKRR